MALQAETVYEVQRSGEPVGSITVEDAGMFDRGWQGEGRLRLNGVPEREAALGTGNSQSAPSQATSTIDPLTESRPQSSSPPMSSADDRPLLRRHSDAPAQPAATTAAAPPPKPAVPP